MNYPVPFLHYGASVTFRKESWLLQLGLSKSESRKIIWYSVDEENRDYWSGKPRQKNDRGLVEIYHPEIQLQFLF